MQVKIYRDTSYTLWVALVGKCALAHMVFDSPTELGREEWRTKALMVIAADRVTPPGGQGFTVHHGLNAVCVPLAHAEAFQRELAALFIGLTTIVEVM